ncbi:6-bladed beta-propeller [Chloroflexota bacterium]
MTFITKWGSPGFGDYQFSTPVGGAVDASGNFYVSDLSNNRIQKFDSSGTYITEWGSQGPGNGQFNIPSGVAVDTSGNVYVCEYTNNRIQKFDSDGVFITKWGSEGNGDSQFNAPRAIAVDASGNVYVTDSLNHRIQVFDSTGNFITEWGSYGQDDGQFWEPTGIAIDPVGRVYITEEGNDRIQVFSTVSQPTVATSAATDVAATSAILNGNLTSLGSAASVNVSFEYGLDTNYGITSTGQAVTSPGPFGRLVGGLLPETTYHYRAKAEGDGIAYGEDMTVDTAAQPSYLDQSYEPAAPNYASSRLDKAQVFTVGITGMLIRVDVDMNRDVGATADLLLDVRPTTGGVPVEDDAAALVTVRIPYSQVPDTRSFFVIDFAATPVPVTAGQVLAIVLRSDPDDGSMGSYSWTGKSNNEYPGGDHYFRHMPGWPRPQWYIEAGPVGMGFRTYMATPPEPGDANGDGSINAQDITSVERIVAGLDDETSGADANNDGAVNALDITKTERLVAGLD